MVITRFNTHPAPNICLAGEWSRRRTAALIANGRDGFTIVELLIVIVVIAILAAITIAAYNGIQERARISSVTSALKQASKKLQVYQVDNPDQLSCRERHQWPRQPRCSRYSRFGKYDLSIQCCDRFHASYLLPHCHHWHDLVQDPELQYHTHPWWVPWPRGGRRQRGDQHRCESSSHNLLPGQWSVRLDNFPLGRDEPCGGLLFTRDRCLGWAPWYYDLRPKDMDDCTCRDEQLGR